MGAGIREIPFPVDQVVTALDPSWTLGDRFVDNRGRIFCLWQISNALAASASPGPAVADSFSTGETAWLQAAHIVTNDVSEALLSATYPIFAGVALGTLAESTGATTLRYGLFLVKGRCTVTATDGGVVAGDILKNHTVDGGCIAIDETATNLTAAATTSGIIGTALATDATYSCDVYVSSILFG